MAFGGHADRPERLNAINRQLMAEVHRARMRWSRTRFARGRLWRRTGVLPGLIEAMPPRNPRRCRGRVASNAISISSPAGIIEADHCRGAWLLPAGGCELAMACDITSPPKTRSWRAGVVSAA